MPQYLKSPSVVATALIAVTSLFPPRLAYQPAGSTPGLEGITPGWPKRASRTSLFSNELHREKISESESGYIALAAEIDAGRLLAELSLIFACWSMFFLISLKPVRINGDEK